MLTAILCLLPALVLVLPLLARRYPGERILVALRGKTPARRLRPSASLAPARRLAAMLARGGLLLGSGLAVRPPPLAASSPSR